MIWEHAAAAAAIPMADELPPPQAVTLPAPSVRKSQTSGKLFANDLRGTT